jgi:hypothetical protein
VFKKPLQSLLEALSIRIARAHLAYETHPEAVLKRRSAAEAADYVTEHSSDAVLVRGQFDLLAHALEAVSLDGLFLEFGVHRGASLRFIAARTKSQVHGFDSFEGLPAHGAGTNWTRSQFDRKGALPAVPANVTLHKGLFKDTLPGFPEAHQGQVAFAHIDCDLYDSTKEVLSALAPCFAARSVLVFDEWFNFPGWRQHEFKAFHEFIGASGFTFRHIGFARQQAALVLESP